jgi:hypothetical protein
MTDKVAEQPKAQLLDTQVKEDAKPFSTFKVSSQAERAKVAEAVRLELGDKAKEFGHICTGNDGCNKTKESKEKISQFATLTSESKKKATDQIKKAAPFRITTTEDKQKAKAQIQSSSSAKGKDFGHICTGGCNLHNQSKLFSSKSSSNNSKASVSSQPRQAVPAASNNSSSAVNNSQSSQVSNTSSPLSQSANSTPTTTTNLSQRGQPSASGSRAGVNIQSQPNGNKQNPVNFARQTANQVAKNVSSQSHNVRSSHTMPLANHRASSSRSSSMSSSPISSNPRSTPSANQAGSKAQARNVGSNANSRAVFSQNISSQPRIVNGQTSSANGKQSPAGVLNQQRMTQPKGGQNLSNQRVVNGNKGSRVQTVQPNMKQALKNFNGNQKGVMSANGFQKATQAKVANQRSITPNSVNAQKSVASSKQAQTSSQKLAKVNAQLGEVKNILSYMGFVSFRQQMMSQDPSLASTLANALASMMAGKMILKEEKNKLLEKYKKLQELKKKLSKELGIPFKEDQEGYLIDWDQEEIAYS